MRPYDRLALNHLILQKKDQYPFSVLGLHHINSHSEFRVFLPDAANVNILKKENLSHVLTLDRIHKKGLFFGKFKRLPRNFSYILEINWTKTKQIIEDPYCYRDYLQNFWNKEKNKDKFSLSYQKLGAHLIKLAGVYGTYFSLWAPHAKKISVIGQFNHWDIRRYPMNKQNKTGIWELFIPDIGENEVYQFHLINSYGQSIIKSDPYAFSVESAPKNYSIVRSLPNVKFRTKEQNNRNQIDKPISIYEVHLGSWKRDNDGNMLKFKDLTQQLIPYVKSMGFTHIEILPIQNHPLYGSWGYQPLCLYAPAPYYGSYIELIDFIEAAHHYELNVILDWVGGHFPEDKWGLAQFDGTSLYEYSDPREGIQHKWQTLIYNYKNPQVRQLLKDNVFFWIKHYGFDGIRMDAVTSMIYRDFCRAENEWIPNKFGGNINLEVIDFLKETNKFIHQKHPGVIMIAEECTSYEGVTSKKKGLGFDYKWNMGWVTDTLNFMKQDITKRIDFYNKIIFATSYAWKENFILSLSHDEVSPGKISMFEKMAGSESEKFSNLRAYYAFMWAHPGKKLIFMGNEFAQKQEWDHDNQLSWYVLNDPYSLHKGIQNLVRDLNHYYQTHPALYQNDVSPEGFRWLIADDKQKLVFAFIRYAKDKKTQVLAISNFSNVNYKHYRLGLETPNILYEVLNTDNLLYGGSTRFENKHFVPETIPHHEFQWSVLLNLPSLSTLYFEVKEQHLD